MSNFNPDDLLHIAVEASNSTITVPVPLGEWPGTLGKPTFKQVTIKNGDRAGEVIYFFETNVEIVDPAVKEETGRDKNFVRYSASIDLNEDGGISTSEGANVDFGRLREACGLNDDPDFTPSMFEGQNIMDSIKHRADPDDATKIYAEAKGVRAPE